MDSLGGILINGLLGNPILARFNLFVEVIIEEITPTPTPTITPTPTLPPINIGGGGGGRYPDLAEHEKLIKVTIIYKGKQHVSIHKINDKTLRISINILNGITYLKEKAYSIFVSMRQKMHNIRVNINGNGNRD